MIGTINIKVSASRPNMPLGPFHVFAGSAASFTIVDIPLPLGVRKVTGVTLSAKNVAGITTGYTAVRVGSAWGVTVPPSKFVASGSVVRGISIIATGVDDAGAAVTPWKLGAGDVFIMEPDGSVAPGETVHDLHWHDSRPANPVGGDVAPHEGKVYYFNGTTWIAFDSRGDVSHSEFADLSTLQPGDSLGIVKERVNMVIGKLKGTVAAVAALLCLESFAALCPTNVLDDVSGTNTIREIVESSGYAEIAANAVVHDAVMTNYLCTVDEAEATYRPLTDNVSRVTFERWEHFGIPSRYRVKLGPLYNNNIWYLTLVDTSTSMTVSNIDRSPANARSLTFVFASFTVRSELRRIATEGKSFVTDDNVPNTNGFVTAQAATNAAEAVVHEAVRTNYLCTVAAAQAMTNDSSVVRGYLDGSVWRGFYVGFSMEAGFAEYDAKNNIIHKYYAPSQTVAQVQSQVSAIGAHLNAEDARFVSTNYNSGTHMPEAYVQIKLPDQSWSVIWSEMTRWNWMLDTYLPTNYFTKCQVNAELAEKADRGWGAYDSETGAFAPDGYTWISSSRIAIAANMAYQKTITTDGAIWVLESNGLVTETGGVSSNGFFRISDDDGNTQFEIVKGDKRTIGADASSCQVVAGFTPTKLQIGYSVLSDSHPTISVCNSLASRQWKSETDADCIANVTWSGSSGAWVAHVQGKSAQAALFVKATYETGGDTIIRNSAPVEMQYLYIGGQKYSVGTASISGQTVLTLQQVN